MNIKGSIRPLRYLKTIFLFLFFRYLYGLKDQVAVWSKRQLVHWLGTLFIFLYIIVFIQSFYNIII